MWESYCGKACEVCPARDAGDCPGCRSGPGSAWSGECDIARCCRNSGHESCDTCTKRTSCGLYDSRERQSEYRARRRADEAEMRGRNAEKAAYMTKWLTPLFWLNIATIAANLMTDENVLGVLPALYWPGTILSLVCYVGIIVTLFKLKAQDELYGKSAGMQIVSLVLSLLGLGYLDSLIVSHLMLSLLISLAAAVFDLLGDVLRVHGALAGARGRVRHHVRELAQALALVHIRLRRDVLRGFSGISVRVAGRAAGPRLNRRHPGRVRTALRLPLAHAPVLQEPDRGGAVT